MDYWMRRNLLIGSAWAAFVISMVLLSIAAWTTDNWSLGQRLLAQAGVLFLTAITAAAVADDM